MSTEETKFFFDFDEGSNWLQKMVDIEENNNGLIPKLHKIIGYDQIY